MKKWFKVLMVSCLMTSGVAFGEETKAADQKWLEVVKSMVSEGQSVVSTPSETRVNLLKDWSKKNGFAANITKEQAGYRIEITKGFAQK